MRAVQVTALDGPEAVTVREVPEPDGEGMVVIDVHAAGVAWPDLLLTRGQYQIKPALPFSLGGEAAGTVRSAPAGSSLTKGQRVAVLTGVGAWQDVLAVPAYNVFPLPDEVSWTAGAGLVFNYLTVHFALLRRGRLAEGETVLVHGATGGIGVATLQVAKAYGARTVAVVSSEAKRQAALDAGADDVVLADGFLDAVRELTDGRGVDLVMDPVGGDRFTDSLRALAVEGRLLVVGFAGGEIPTVKVNRLLLNNISVIGVGWGAFLATDTAFVQQQWAELVPLLQSGAVRAVEGEAYPAERAVEALLSMQDRTLVNKAVLLFQQ